MFGSQLAHGAITPKMIDILDKNELSGLVESLYQVPCHVPHELECSAQRATGRRAGQCSIVFTTKYSARLHRGASCCDTSVAAAYRAHSLHHGLQEDWDLTFAVNVKSMFLAVKAFLPRMAEVLRRCSECVECRNNTLCKL